MGDADRVTATLVELAGQGFDEWARSLPEEDRGTRR
jgi:hypothetical protein